jgi:hypothetical protein
METADFLQRHCLVVMHKNGIFLTKFDSASRILNTALCVMSEGYKMYMLMLLSLAFYTIGVALFAWDLVKKKPADRGAYPEGNIWKDAEEWSAFKRKRNISNVDLSF